MIVLASKSASRQAMLAAAGVAFEIRPAELDERSLERELSADGAMGIALGLAEAKARAVSDAMPGRLVLGSDSLVTVDGRRFDKPASREQAAEHLRAFSNKWMSLHSAASIARDGRQVWYHHSLAQLLVRGLSDDFIERYLDAEWPAVAGCVGVFRMEGPGVQLFSALEGDYFTVLGMPLLLVLGALRELGELAS
jgi:septum formation protein